jgi:L-ribulose-5-phosphate 3-epimerase
MTVRKSMSRFWTRRAFLGTSLAACLPLAAEGLARTERSSSSATSNSGTSNSSMSNSGASKSETDTIAGGWHLGIITDEISQKLEDALDFISSYHLPGCELREFWGRNIMNTSAADLDHARRLISEHSLRVSDIASPIFKWNLPQMPAHDEPRDNFGAAFTDRDADKLLHQAFELAHSFGTSKVRIFSYWRVPEPEKAYPYVRDRLAQAAELAGRNDILLVLENEHTCNAGTGREAGKLIAEINSPHLKVNWDPGNAAMLGETPYPDGYHAVRGLMGHLHIKDVRKDAAGKLHWAPVGGGFIDWRGQFKALQRDGYNDTMSLETHYRRPDGNTLESTRESLTGLLKIVQEIPRTA